MVRKAKADEVAGLSELTTSEELDLRIKRTKQAWTRTNVGEKLRRQKVVEPARPPVYECEPASPVKYTPAISWVLETMRTRTGKDPSEYRRQVVLLHRLLFGNNPADLGLPSGNIGVITRYLRTNAKCKDLSEIPPEMVAFSK